MNTQDKLRELIDRLTQTGSQSVKSGYDEGYNDACNYISDELEAILNSGDSGEWVLVRKDAEEWGSALNAASWEFIENCPEKSALLFNHCKTSLRLAILKYLDKVTPTLQADGSEK